MSRSENISFDFVVKIEKILSNQSKKFISWTHAQLNRSQ